VNRGLFVSASEEQTRGPERTEAERGAWEKKVFKRERSKEKVQSKYPLLYLCLSMCGSEIFFFCCPHKPQWTLVDSI